MYDLSFYKGKRVFLTGHTGFKGMWLSLLLLRAGAEVTGLHRYYNSALIAHPYNKWSAEERADLDA